MSTQRYNLLTSCIVSAIHPNVPQKVGTKWEPENPVEQQEAAALRKIGYAETVVSSKGDQVTLTLRQRKAKRAETQPEPEQEQEQEQETVSEDDEMLALILDGSVPQVEAELDGLAEADLRRLDELEREGKGRTGVLNAIADALSELDPE